MLFQNKTKNIQAWFGVLLVLLGTFLLAMIGYRYASGVLSDRYTIVYGIMYIAFFFIGTSILIWDYFGKVKEENPIGETFFFWENNSSRVFSQLIPVQLGLWILITIMVVLIAVGTGKTLIPVSFQDANPYGEGLLSADVLAFHSVGENLLYVGVYPSFGEEFGIFVMVSIIVFLLGKLWAVPLGKGAKSFLVLTFDAVIGSLVGAWIFTLAHGVSYGQNVQAYVSAFLFEFSMQFFNQTGGIFLSWLPHLVHNSLFTLGLTTAFSIGGVVALSYFIPIYIKKNSGDIL